MKPENPIGRPRVKNLPVVLAFLVLAVLIIGTSLFATVSAQKGGVKPPSDSKKGDEDKGALEAARAALQKAIDSGAFEQMSSAKQMALLLRAKMRYEDGVLKEADALPSPPSGPGKNASDGVSAGDSPLAALANPLVNNPALDATAQKTQSETTIVSTGGMNLVAAYNDSGSFLAQDAFTGYSTSTDMGATWTDRGAVPILTNGNFGDPVLARNNTTGTVYLATLASINNGVNIYRSTDAGVTWSAVANGAPGTLADDGDKEWITVDNFGGTGNGNVYNAYRDFSSTSPGIRFTRSTDGGLTFGPNPGLVLNSTGQGAFTFVGADHSVYAGYFESNTTPRQIQLRKSTDLGVTFAPEVTVTTLTTTGINGDLAIPAGYRSSAFPQMVANPGAANNLYCVHNDITAPDRGDIYFQHSTDGGATWSARAKVNADATTNVQAFPSIAVTPDGSSLCVSWYDDRNDPLNRKVERFGAIATISGTTVTFGPNFKIGNASWTPVFGADPVVVSTYMGDYDQMVADNSNFHNTFVDCRLGDQDVRFAKIPLAGPGAVLSVTSFNPNSLAVATNSCNDLFATLTNNGTATAIAVSLTLTTATPGVTLPVNMQSYGNIAAGASATNASAFKLSIDNTFLCGTNIVINWTTNTGDSGSFTITTTGLGYAQSTMTGQTIVPGTVRIDGTGADDATFPVTIPFPFAFNGTTFTAAVASSNGNLQFTSNNTAFTNACLPTATMNNLISPHWDDLRTDTLGTNGIFTSVSGSMPNRIFNIEWRAIYFGTTTTINFEIRLYETTGQIDFVYGTLNGTGSSATAGVQKGTGAVPANDVSQFSCNTASLSAGLKVTFTPGTTCPTGAGVCGGCTAVTCPANITTSATTGQCSAVVTYPAPTTTGACTVTCAPASGSTFPKGTTTVTCSNTGGTPSCTFTITVTDTQPPSITCPADQTAVTNQNACPAPACQVVNYPAPVATDNCPGVTVACTPASGSCFPTGTTTVTCTATDASANMATCSFMVTTFDSALQDDSNAATILLWNSITGQYRFCCNGTIFTGVGKSTVQGCVYTLQHNPADKRVLGRVDKAAHAGAGSIQAPAGTTRCTITDRNTLNDTLLPACQ